MIAHLSEEPLTKVTLNLFTRDYEIMKQVYGQGYSTIIRGLVRSHAAIHRAKLRSFERDYEE